MFSLLVFLIYEKNCAKLCVMEDFFWVSRTFGQGAQTKMLSRTHLKHTLTGRVVGFLTKGPRLSQNSGNVVLSFWFANFWVSRTFGQGAQTKVLSRTHLNDLYVCGNS